MKKLAFLLIAALCLSLLPAGALAEETAPSEEPIEAAEEPAYQAEPPAGTESAPAAAEEADLSAGETVPAADGDTSGTCGVNLNWETTPEGRLTIYGSGSMTDFGSGVNDTLAPWGKTIGSGYNIKTNPSYVPITTLDIYEGAASVGNCALQNEKSLTTVLLPEGLTRIGDLAFQNCSSLPEISLPESLLTIGACAFQGCTGLTSVKIPANTAAVSMMAFAGCTGLKEVYFTGHAPSFGKSCFYSCTATVCYPENDGTWTDEVRQNYGGTITWEAYNASGSGTETPGGFIALGTCGTTVRWQLTDDGVLTISGSGDMSNYRYGSSVRPWENYFPLIKEIVIGEGVNSVGSAAFACESLNGVERVTLADSVTDIGEYAFYHCTALKEIGIPKNVSRIGSFAFGGCESLKKIYFYGYPPTFDGSQFSSAGQAFYGVAAKAYYPPGNELWTKSVMQNYGGTLTWLMGDFFLIGKDNNRFWNNGPAMNAGHPEPDEIGTAYPVSQALFSRLVEGIDHGSEAALIGRMFNYEPDKLYGACEGITLSMILANNGMIDIVDVCSSSNVKCYHDAIPRENKKLKELINYYQLLQYTGKLESDAELINQELTQASSATFKEAFQTAGVFVTAVSWKPFWSDFFAAVKEGCERNTAVLLTFAWGNNNIMHSVVACGIDDSEDAYTVVKLYDCDIQEMYDKEQVDKPEQYTYLVVYHTGSRSDVFLSKTDDPADRINPYFTGSDWKVFGYYTADTIFSIDPGTDTQTPQGSGVSQPSTVFETDMGAAFTLKNADGQTFSFDGTAYGGNMELLDLDFIASGDASTVRYTLPVSGSYTLTGIEDGAEYGIITEDSCYTAQTAGADEILFIDGRGVEIAGEDYTFEVGVSMTDTIGLMRVGGAASGDGQFLHGREDGRALDLAANGTFTNVSVRTITEDGVSEASLGGSYGHIVVDDGGAPSPGPDIRPGDADISGVKTALDAVYILRAAVGLQPTVRKYTPADAAEVLSFIPTWTVIEHPITRADG